MQYRLKRGQNSFMVDKVTYPRDLSEEQKAYLGIMEDYKIIKVNPHDTLMISDTLQDCGLYLQIPQAHLTHSERVMHIENIQRELTDLL